MYVSMIGRSLGDVTQASGMPQPSPARAAELSKTCATQWKAYQKAKGKNFPRPWRAFLAQNPACREGIAIRWGYQPENSNPCMDANTGLLIDCWNAALQKGVNLNGLGAPMAQARLTQMSKWYGGLPHAQQKALRNPTGYVFNGTKMVRNRTRGLGAYRRALGRYLGQDDGSDFTTDFTDITTMPIGASTSSVLPPYSTPVDISSGVPYSPDILAAASTPITASAATSGPAPLSDAWWNEILPGTTSSASSGTSLLSQLLSSGTQLATAAIAPGTAAKPATTSALGASTIISGVPNIILYAAAGFLVLALFMGGGSRRR